MPALAQRRILITRPRGQGSALAVQLEALGAIPILIPTIEIAEPASYCALDAALTTLRSFDWVVFTSANGVEAYARRAHQLGLLPYPRRVAVIGPATAAAVKASRLSPDEPELLMPTQYVAESLADALLGYASGARMLLPRAAAARDVLPEMLLAAGAEVTVAEAYRSIVPAGSVEELRALFAGEPPDAITFTSASTAHHLAAVLRSAGLSVGAGIALASIGPITSDAMREHNLQPTLEAAQPTIPALV